MKLFVGYVYTNGENPFPKFGNYIFDTEYDEDEKECVELLINEGYTYKIENRILRSIKEDCKELNIISVSKIEG
jgi:hypothetical protein